jgi:hypothetical protein
MSEVGPDDGSRECRGQRPVVSRRSLLRGAALLLGSLIVDGIGGALHATPPTGDANDLAATFPGIAESDAWPAAHFLQFAASLIFAAGLLVLFRAVADAAGPSILDRWGPATTVAAAAVGSVQYAVDGVALKQAVDAWASAPPGESAAAFRTAELARWLEWGITSYATLLLGTALVLLGVAVSRHRVLPRWLGVLIAAPGVVDLVTGVLLGHQGFSATVVAVSAPTVLLLPVAALAIGVVAWRQAEFHSRG